MITWCTKNREIPEDENQAFVVSYQINIDNDSPENYPVDFAQIVNPEKSARFFLSTVNLLKLTSEHCVLLQADATYKLNWYLFER